MREKKERNLKIFHPSVELEEVPRGGTAYVPPEWFDGDTPSKSHLSSSLNFLKRKGKRFVARSTEEGGLVLYRVDGVSEDFVPPKWCPPDRKTKYAFLKDMKIDDTHKFMLTEKNTRKKLALAVKRHMKLYGGWYVVALETNGFCWVRRER